MRAAEWLLCVSNVPVMLIVCGSVRVCVCLCGGVYLEGDTRVVHVRVLVYLFFHMIYRYVTLPCHL